MTSLFWTAIFGISNCRTAKQMTFLEYWDRTGQDSYVLKRIFWVRKFGFFDLSLTWPSVRYENERCRRILRSKWPIRHVSHDTRAIFLCSDLIWPDLDIDLYLTFASYLHDIFVIPSVEFWAGLKLAAVAVLVSATDKGETIQLWPLTWPWPDIWPC